MADVRRSLPCDACAASGEQCPKKGFSQVTVDDLVKEPDYWVAHFQRAEQARVIFPGVKVALFPILVAAIALECGCKPYQLRKRDGGDRIVYGPTQAAASDQEKAYALAMRILQSDLYSTNPDVRDAVDAVLAIHRAAEGQ